VVEENEAQEVSVRLGDAGKAIRLTASAANSAYVTPEGKANTEKTGGRQ
jgi:hypothetical protein